MLTYFAAQRDQCFGENHNTPKRLNVQHSEYSIIWNNYLKSWKRTCHQDRCIYKMHLRRQIYVDWKCQIWIKSIRSEQKPNVRVKRILFYSPIYYFVFHQFITLYFLLEKWIAELPPEQNWVRALRQFKI